MAMKVLVLGACGLQGRAAVYFLSACSDVSEIICADYSLDNFEKIERIVNIKQQGAAKEKLRPLQIDVSDFEKLTDLYGQADVVIDLLPRTFADIASRAGVKTGKSVVNSNYIHETAKYDQQAKEAGIAIVGECGLDPGIDLVFYSRALGSFDEVHVINSYCGGFPEKAACDNPLNYKISWTWEGVLSSSMRDARVISNGREKVIRGADQHKPDNIAPLEFPGLGTLESIPNGDAVYFTDLFGITDKIREAGRYALRWPGWSAFWNPLKQLGFLEKEPVYGLKCAVTPYEFMDRFLAPRLQYKENEKDLVVMVNVFEGLCGGRKKRLTGSMLIERDLETGLMAMSKGVGYPAAIAARMIADGRITDKGVLTPALHVPWEPFFTELGAQGIEFTIKEEWI